MGACVPGTQTCAAGSYGTCTGQVIPSVETCDNVDNNCNGNVDESLTRSCYAGPTGTAGVGICRAGTQTCTSGSWGSTCPGEVLPGTDVCNGVDDDCDGLADGPFTGVVPSSTPRVLIYGPSQGSVNTVLPAGSVVTVASDSAWRALTTQQFATYNMLVVGPGCSGTACQGLFDTRNTWTPAVTGRVIAETSHAIEHAQYNGPRAWMRWIVAGFGTGLYAVNDEDTPSFSYMTAFGSFASRAVGYNPGSIVEPGHPAMAGVSNGDITMGSNHASMTAWPSNFTVLARPGTLPSEAMVVARDSQSGGMGALGATCTAGVGACARTGVNVCTADQMGTVCNATPGSPTTETCNNIDDDCDGMVDEGITRSCYTGPSGTSGVGACAPGVETCSAGTYGSCTGQTLPSTETCDNVDNDCDASVDESLTQSCYTGPSGTSGVGVCRAGTQTCAAGSWGSTCPGEVVPGTERCDAQDNNCDGVVDEPFLSQFQLSTLTASSCVLVDHNGVTSDDRGGIAISGGERLLLGRLADGPHAAEPVVGVGALSVASVRRADGRPADRAGVHPGRGDDAAGLQRRDGHVDHPDRQRGRAEHGGHDHAEHVDQRAERVGHLRGLRPDPDPQHVARVPDLGPRAW
nr:hypothetical protein [Deltaproteobacteria bacterium]